MPAPSRTTASDLFGIDLRSLAAFRIGVAAIVLAKLASRAPYLEALYTDRGLIPRELLFAKMPDPTPLGIHGLSGSYGFEAALFALAALCAAMMLVGYRTWLATFATWLLWLSLLYRNPFILDGGDQLLRVALFWCLFLPLGARASLDRRLRPASAPPGPQVLSIASLALLLQIAFVYFFSGLLKSSSPDWSQDLSAVFYTLSDAYSVRPLAGVLVGAPELLQVATAGTLALEIAGPILLFSPFRTSYARGLVVVTLVLFQISLALCIRLNFFPLINCVALLLFVPGSVWRRLGWREATS